MSDARASTACLRMTDTILDTGASFTTSSISPTASFVVDANLSAATSSASFTSVPRFPYCFSTPWNAVGVVMAKRALYPFSRARNSTASCAFKSSPFKSATDSRSSSRANASTP